MQPHPVSWPAIIKIDGDAELTFIRDQTAWEQNSGHHHFRYRSSDALIDSSGSLYSLTTQVNGYAIPEPASRTMTLEDIAALVRAHAAQANACCIEKISASSIKDIIQLVESLDD